MKLYSYIVWYDDTAYSGHVVATGIQEAQAICQRNGWEFDGEVLESIPICDMCEQAIRNDVESQSEMFYWIDGGENNH